jgi:hypothetical protein
MIALFFAVSSNLQTDGWLYIEENSSCFLLLQVGLFVKAYRECIEVLKNSIGIEEKQAHGACQLASSIGKGFSKHRLYCPISMVWFVNFSSTLMQVLSSTCA